MKIRTTQHYAREWTAIDDDTYDYDAPIGYGNTEQEAIDDLMARLEEDAEADDPDCTCPERQCNETGYPYKILDQWCPVHGRDPDQAYDEMRDRELFG